MGSLSRIRLLAALVPAILCVCAANASAHADFAPVPSPCAPGVGIGGFTVSGSAWLALCSATGSPQTNVLRLTNDHGAAWSDVELAVADGFPPGPVTAPDGAFAVLRLSDSASELDRIDPQTGAVTVTPGPPVPSGVVAAGAAAPAWQDGRALVAIHGLRLSTRASVLAVWRQGADGSWTSLGEQTWNGAIGGDFGFVDVGGVTYVQDDGHVFEVTGSGLAPAPPLAPLPAVQLAGVTDTPTGLSLDGGATVAWPDLHAEGVKGDASLVVIGRDVVRPYNATMLAGTGMQLPEEGMGVVRVAGGYVAVPAGAYSGGLAFAPDGPAAALSPRFSGWLARANALRAQAGLAPLVGDAGISRAAENHSRYWTLNPPPAGLGVHYETSGRPGFTGERASDRCDAVGARCGSEIMYGIGVSLPIDGWVATVYHRGLLLDPTSFSAGGGMVAGGPAVVDGGSPSGLLIAPTEFPRGTYTGPLDFSGESPDPAVECKKKGQPVGRPFGTVVTAWAPSGTLSDIAVRPRGRAALQGCRLDDSFRQASMDSGPALHFLPARSLSRGTTYDVSASWHPTGSAAAKPVAWSFTTAGTRSAQCRPAIRLASRTVRRGRPLRVSYHACSRGKLVVRVVRKAKPRLRKSLRVSRLRGTSAIKTGALAPGRYRLTATLGRVHRSFGVRVRPRHG